LARVCPASRAFSNLCSCCSNPEHLESMCQEECSPGPMHGGEELSKDREGQLQQNMEDALHDALDAMQAGEGNPVEMMVAGIKGFAQFLKGINENLVSTLPTLLRVASRLQEDQGLARTLAELLRLQATLLENPILRLQNMLVLRSTAMALDNKTINWAVTKAVSESHRLLEDDNVSECLAKFTDHGTQLLGAAMENDRVQHTVENSLRLLKYGFAAQNQVAEKVLEYPIVKTAGATLCAVVNSSAVQGGFARASSVAGHVANSRTLCSAVSGAASASLTVMKHPVVCTAATVGAQATISVARSNVVQSSVHLTTRAISGVWGSLSYVPQLIYKEPSMEELQENMKTCQAELGEIELRAAELFDEATKLKSQLQATESELSVKELRRVALASRLARINNDLAKHNNIGQAVEGSAEMMLKDDSPIQVPTTAVNDKVEDDKDDISV